jgi:hypothetical protein
MKNRDFAGVFLMKMNQLSEFLLAKFKENGSATIRPVHVTGFGIGNYYIFLSNTKNI